MEGDPTSILRFKLGKTRRNVDRVLRELVRDAYQHVFAYRDLLDDAGVPPDALRGREDLPRLPIVTKQGYFQRSALSDVLRVGTNIDRCRSAKTSGSTGVPITVFMSRTEATFRRVLVLRSWMRAARLSLPLTIADLRSWVPERKVVSTRYGFLIRVVRIPMGLPVEAQVRALRAQGAQILTGHPTALDVLAVAMDPSYAMANSLRLVATRGEILHEGTRRRIEEVFGCRVVDVYGSEEAGTMAWECSADPSRLHVNTDGCLIEVVDSSGRPVLNGEEGRILVTNLFNRTMPFVRYDLEDRGRILAPGGERCACGSRAPQMALLSGRDDDFILLSDGERISPRLIATVVDAAFWHLPAGEQWLRRFQVVQDGVDHLKVRVEPAGATKDELASLILPAVRRLHPKLACSIEIADRFTPGPGGKFKKVLRLAANSERTV